MKNSVTVQIRFSFRGENHAPQATIELDDWLEKGANIPPFFDLVARENAIDPYSYQYEVMEMGQYVYSNASGLAAQYCRHDAFDIEGFIEHWQQARVMRSLQQIARDTLGVDELQADEKLGTALLAAYRLGQQHGA